MFSVIPVALGLGGALVMDRYEALIFTKTILHPPIPVLFSALIVHPAPGPTCFEKGPQSITTTVHIEG